MIIASKGAAGVTGNAVATVLIGLWTKEFEAALDEAAAQERRAHEREVAVGR